MNPYLSALNERHQEARRNMQRAGEEHAKRQERERNAADYGAEQLAAKRGAEIEVLRRELRAARVKIAELEARWASGLSLWNEAGDRIPAKKIVACVARAHNQLIADVLGPRRSRSLVNTRHHLVARLRVMRSDLSLPEIGRIVGGRDHCTVINSIRKWPYVAPDCQREIAAVDKMLGAMVARPE